jgi:site-specific DNA-cytosine methylase
MLLDLLEELGYVIDIDIIDAQYCGVPQRRRRIFICAQKVSSLLQSKTISSGLTVAQCLIENLHLGLAVLSERLIPEQENLESKNGLSDLSLQRRMRLFGMDLEGQASILLDNLVVLQRSSGNMQLGLDSENGNAHSKTTLDTESRKLNNETGCTGGYQNIDTLSKSTLADSLRALNECITSTAERDITLSTIYSFAQTTLLITKLITPSLNCCPPYWSAASSALTALEAFTDYARSTSSNLFGDVERFQAWGDFIREAEHQDISIRHSGNWQGAGQVLSFPEGLQGDPPPRREAGKGVTHDFAPSLTGSGRGVERGGDSRGQDPVAAVESPGPYWDGSDIADTLDASNASKQQAMPEKRRFQAVIEAAHTTGAGFWKEGCGTLRGREQDSHENLVTHSLRGEGFDASEECCIDGCQCKPHAKGMCASHYHRFKRHGDPLLGRVNEGEPLGFLESYISHATDECVLWPYAQFASGYGSVEFEGRTTRVHRLMCELAHGEPPAENLDACHSCGVRLCINPQHLRWGTREENMADAIAHDTTTRGERHASHKLKEGDVLDILNRLKLGETHESISQIYGVGRNTITDIAKGKNWAWLSRQSRPMGELGVTHSLCGEGFDSSEDGTGRGTPLVPVVTGTMKACAHSGGFSNSIDHAAAGYIIPILTSNGDGHTGFRDEHGLVAFQSSQSGIRECETHATLDSNNGSRRHNGVIQGMEVRRLTPRECEKLQGAPPGHTQVPFRGKPMADGPRYKLCGNGFAVPVVAWIGERIQKVEESR